MLFISMYGILCSVFEYTVDVYVRKRKCLAGLLVAHPAGSLPLLSWGGVCYLGRKVNGNGLH